jgi:predicted tellurium resistance membrane protein TerC
MDPKPGYKTTEFWLAFAAVMLGAFVASGAVPLEGTASQIVGLIQSALVALGYTGARLTLKNSGPTGG